MAPERTRTNQVAKLRFGRIVVFLSVLLLADGMWHTAPPWEYGLLNDFHFSLREELGDEEAFQIDNYYSMDVYRMAGKVDFHSAFLVTNDLNLLDREAIQLTLAYLSVERLLGKLDMRAGRQLFAESFDAFLGDGLQAKVRVSPLVNVSLHVAAPFDAESEAIDDEPMLVYGIGLETPGWGSHSRLPLTLAASVERRDRTNVDGLDQTLVGLKAAAELRSPVESDLYAAVQYEAEDSRMRGVRLGSRLYLTPRLVCHLEGKRYDPDQRQLKQQVDQFLSDAIVNYFSGSEVWSARAALSYSLPRGRELTVSYSGQWHDRRNGKSAFGQGPDCFFTFLSAPSIEGKAGAGYSGRIFEQDSIHLVTLRGSAIPLPRLEMRFSAESGMMNTRSWQDYFVLHVRGQVEYSARPNLRISLAVEENRNPYFNSDLRGMMFLRYFWEGGVK
jgi:hypothetical protein